MNLHPFEQTVARPEATDRQAIENIDIGGPTMIRAAAESHDFACDPQSAFGGVIALNRPVDRVCAEAVSGQFVEVLLAPGFEYDALSVLREKKNVRLLELAPEAASQRPAGLDAKPVIAAADAAGFAMPATGVRHFRH